MVFVPICIELKVKNLKYFVTKDNENNQYKINVVGRSPVDFLWHCKLLSIIYLEII